MVYFRFSQHLRLYDVEVSSGSSGSTGYIEQCEGSIRVMNKEGF